MPTSISSSAKPLKPPSKGLQIVFEPTLVPPGGPPGFNVGVRTIQRLDKLKRDFMRRIGRWPEFAVLLHDGRRVVAISVEGEEPVVIGFLIGTKWRPQPAAKSAVRR